MPRNKLKAKARKQKRPKKRVTGKILTHILYGYLQPRAFLAAKKKSQSPKFGTLSGYVNYLICRDCGLKVPHGLKGQMEAKPGKRAKPKRKAAKKRVSLVKKIKHAVKAAVKAKAKERKKTTQLTLQGLLDEPSAQAA